MIALINEFSGEYRFLSNFSPAEVVLDGVTYRTVEHAFQAAKMERDGILTFEGFQLAKAERTANYRAAICEVEKPGVAKAIGQTAKLRDGWEGMKIQVMRDLLRQKFKRGTPHANMLMKTHPAHLVEGNWWGDTFWGECRGKGRNELGKLLMMIRADLISDRNVGIL